MKYGVVSLYRTCDSFPPGAFSPSLASTPRVMHAPQQPLRPLGTCHIRLRITPPYRHKRGAHALLLSTPIPLYTPLTFFTFHLVSCLMLAAGALWRVCWYLLAAYRDGPALETPSTTVIFFRSRGSRPIAASTLPARGLGMPHTMARYALRTVRALN